MSQLLEIVIAMVGVAAACASAVAAVAATRIASKLADITVAATRPNVIVVSRRGTGAEKYCVFLVVRNVGQGAAYDVSFQLEGIASQRGLKSGDGFEAFKRGHPLIDGISAIGPGEERTLLWGSINEMWNGMQGAKGSITVQFKDDRGVAQPSTLNPVSIDDFETRSLVLTDEYLQIARRSADSLRRIEDRISALRA